MRTKDIKQRCLDLLWSAVSIGLAVVLLIETPSLDMEAVLYFLTHMLTALLFLIRHPPLARPPGKLGYMIAGLSTVYVYAYDFSAPASTVATVGRILLLAGATLCLCGLVSLGRCFGVLPICRGVTTSGMYRVVRHPIYASYLLMDVGLILTALSPRNLLLFMLGTTLFLTRICQEESLLQTQPEYRDYLATVKFRLVPFIY